VSALARIDSGLIEAARGGDAAALDRLLSVSQPDLMRFARRSCTNAEDAEDAVQTALWQLHRHIGTLRVIAAFTSWLFRIVERECRRLLGLQRGSLPLDAVPEAALAVDPIPSGLRRDLGAMIAALPEAYRTVLVLRDIEELTAPEAAAQLDISVEAVKSRLRRAREMLRDRLLDAGYWSS
jgi:RNA polymerase sigma factor (sigma-70 family)